MTIFFQALCSMLVYSLWYAFVLFVTVCVVLPCFGKMGSTAHYRVYLVALLAFCVLCIQGFVASYRLLSTASLPPTPHLNPLWCPCHLFPARWLPDWLPAVVQGVLPYLFGTWLFCWSGKVLWFVRQHKRLQHLLRGASPVSTSFTSEHLAPLLQTHGLQRYLPHVLVCDRIMSPLVVGHGKPTILLPAALLHRLPAEELRAVVLHELMHARRRDYTVNLFQVLLETVFFFNPCFVWLSCRMREVREHCCDDTVVAMTGDKLTYLKALTRSYEMSLTNTSSVALAFLGERMEVYDRAKRLTGELPAPLRYVMLPYLGLGTLLNLFVVLHAAPLDW